MSPQAVDSVRTVDGHRLRLLVDARRAEELVAGLQAGGTGLGILRTEASVARAESWPSAQAHEAIVRPVLAALGGRRPATICLLDVVGPVDGWHVGSQQGRGIALLLSEPTALRAQLAGIVRAAEGAPIRLLAPGVESPWDLERLRVALARVASQPLGSVELGAIVRSERGMAAVEQIAEAADFIAICVDELAAELLTGDVRFLDAPAHHPRVLAAIARAVAAGEAAGISVEMSGYSAARPQMVALLVGLGVDVLTIRAAHVATVAHTIESISLAEVTRLARRALRARSAAEVAQLVDETIGDR